MTWSRSSPVSADQLAWFGNAFKGRVKSPSKQAVCQQPLSQHAKYIIWFMLALNAIPLLANFSGTWFLSAIGALAIYLPAIFLDNNDQT
jgi:hypothetical protein